MFRRKQDGGRLMILAEMIDNTIVSPIRAREDVKLISKTPCELLESVLLP